MKYLFLISILSLSKYVIGQQIDLCLVQRSIITSVRITKTEICSSDRMKLNFVDSAAYSHLLDYIAEIPDSTLLRNFSSIDHRMLIVLSEGRDTVLTIGLSNYGLIAIQTNKIYDYSDAKIIKELKKYVPAFMGWYDATDEDIAESRSRYAWESLGVDYDSLQLSLEKKKKKPRKSKL